MYPRVNTAELFTFNCRCVASQSVAKFLVLYLPLPVAAVPEAVVHASVVVAERSPSVRDVAPEPRVGGGLPDVRAVRVLHGHLKRAQVSRVGGRELPPLSSSCSTHAGCKGGRRNPSPPLASAISRVSTMTVANAGWGRSCEGARQDRARHAWRGAGRLRSQSKPKLKPLLA